MPQPPPRKFTPEPPPRKFKPEKDIGTCVPYPFLEAGRWFWDGHSNYKRLHLTTETGGRIYVMDFKRWGMDGAQPRFQTGRGEEKHGWVAGVMQPASEMLIHEVDYRDDIQGVDHPVARLLEAAPELYELIRQGHPPHAQDKPCYICALLSYVIDGHNRPEIPDEVVMKMDEKTQGAFR